MSRRPPAGAVALALALATCVGATPTCPPMADLEVEPQAGGSGGEQELTCEYVEAGGLPWPAGRLRATWRSGGALGAVSDLCSDTPDNGMGAFLHAPGKAALVATRRIEGAAGSVAQWEAAARALLGQVEALAASCEAVGRAAAKEAVARTVLVPKEGQDHYELGEAYFYGRDGKPRDYAKAYAAYLAGAETGHAASEYSVAWMLWKGRGVKQDMAAAIPWAEKAAGHGYGLAMDFLGDRHYYGQGVEKDYATAVRWYEKGAEAGNSAARYSLAFMLENGYGTRKDLARANRVYKQAAAQGSTAAMYGLGMLAYKGEGVPKDMDTAWGWFQKGAAKNQRDCHYMLGQMLEKGEGRQANRREALEHYRKAATGGHAKAKARVQALGG